MSLSNDQIIEAISAKSLIEVMELVKAMEEKFGVSAAAPVAMAAAPGRRRCRSGRGADRVHRQSSRPPARRRSKSSRSSARSRAWASRKRRTSSSPLRRSSRTPSARTTLRSSRRIWKPPARPSRSSDARIASSRTAHGCALIRGPVPQALRSRIKDEIAASRPHLIGFGAIRELD